MLTKISTNWLKDFVDFSQNDEEISEILSLSGTLVEKIENQFSNVVVAKIEKVWKHPNADKLQIATVFDGKESRQIVCGAPNIAAGQLVPLALPGAKFGDFEIKKSEIRGIESNGMLCSQKELGLGDDHSGILILEQSLEAGESLSEIFNSDSIFEVEITPNRGDCLSHLGIAREIAACTAKSVKKEPQVIKMSGENIKELFSLEVEDGEECPIYCARLIKNVKITDSPTWLKNRLLSCGITPINNIVDVTNFIMLDLGQPMHAFDADKISSKKILVRNAKNGEQITSFDGTIIDLINSDIVITDGKKPIALAGVVGSIDSGILSDTTNVILEAASFNRKAIRATMKRLRTQTDAGSRFERGVDPKIAQYAIDKAARLIKEIAGGSVSTGILKFESALAPAEIKIQSEKINSLLGTELADQEMQAIFRRLGFAIHGDIATVPSWRPDCSIWQDLAEEIVRIYGLVNLKKRPVEKTDSKNKSAYFYKEFLKDQLTGAGYSEVYNYSFMSNSDAKLFGLDEKVLVEVENPIAPENRFMRSSLIYGLLKNISKNGVFDPIAIFEIGKVFEKKNEKFNLCVAFAGKNSKAKLSELIENLSEILKYSPKAVELSKDELQKYKIKKNSVSYFEIDLSDIEKKFLGDKENLKLKVPKDEFIYRSISKFPSIVRDLAFIVDRKVNAKEVATSIKNESNEVILAELFDEFSSDKLGENKKNIAYHLHLQSAEKTLKDIEAEEIIAKIIKSIEKKFNAKLRKA